MTPLSPLAPSRPLATAPDASLSRYHVTSARAVEALVRFGIFTRGLVYVIPGAFALRLATSGQGETISPIRAIEWIGDRPFGRLAVIVVALGLTGYVLWGLIRCLFDALGKGHSMRGIAARLGYLTSALAYGGMLLFTVHLVNGTHAHVRSMQEWAATLLSKPFGPWLLGIVALGWIAGGGLTQLVSAARTTFMSDLDVDRMSPTERTAALVLGRLGIGARGIVFLAIGVTLFAAALHVDPQESTDIAGALAVLLHQPFGRPILMGVSIGLIAFGTYSMMCARWARVGVSRPAVGFTTHPFQ